MEQLFITLHADLQTISIGFLILLTAWLSNMVFSMFYNIKILRQMFRWELLRTGIYKVIVVMLGTILLITAIDCTAVLCNAYINFDDSIYEIVTALSLVSVIGKASLKYIQEAYSTFSKILVDHVEG